MENAATRSFYTTLFPADNPEWHCTKTRAKLREENLELSHTSMDGHQTLEPGRVTTGVLSVRPSEANNERFLRGMTDALLNGAQFCLSEMATPRHPIYVDFDMTLNVRDHDQVQMVVDVIRTAGVRPQSGVALDDCLLFNKQSSADGRTLQYLNFNKRDILNHHASLLEFMNQQYPEQNYSWLQVFEACLRFDITPAAAAGGGSNSAFGTEGMLYSRLDGPLVTVLATHFILAVGRLSQDVIARFYPSLVDDTRLEMAVLGSYHGDRHVPWTPRYEVIDGKVKIGAHLHMRGLKVDHNSDLLLHEGLVDYFGRHFSRRGGLDWRQVFDLAVYREGSGGLRMPFNYKMEMCSCKHRGRACPRCRQTGRVLVDRYYGPVGVLLACGQLDDTERTLDRWFKNVLFVLTMCSLRISPELRLTPGFVKPADVPEPDTLQLRRAEFKDRFGTQFLKRMEAKRLPNDSVITDDQLTHELEAKIFMVDSSLKMSPARLETLLPHVPHDGRFETVVQWLPAMAARLMNPQYTNVHVSSVVLVRACKDGEPETLYVYVRGESANLCHNRISEAPARGLADAYWNAHNGWRNTVYFCINRVGLTLTQKCSNANERSTRRNKDPVSQLGCCKTWSGVTRKMDPSAVGQPMDDDGMRFFKAVVRNMFYRRSEQSAMQSAAVLATQAQRLQRLYRKRAFNDSDIVGNDEQYEAMLRSRLTGAAGKRARGDGSFTAEGSMDGFS
jgi:hypothetical protein